MTSVCQRLVGPLYVHWYANVPHQFGSPLDDESMARMPKSYELKLREADERRRKPKQQEAFWRV